METQKSIPVNEDIRLIPLCDIIRDPNQPRKTFYEIPMEELRESVRGVGIMQSLLLRPHGNKYMIIFGERRYRVANELGINKVPAIIKEATDEQALQMQLIENLQRESVPVMEQAISFKRLAEKCKMPLDEIAATSGKSVYFIRQQIKLTELLPEWQAMVAKKAIPMTTALEISMLPEIAQKELYKNHVRKEDEKDERPIIQINQYALNQYKGLLSEACFDITDPELDKKAGACIVCPFNTACNSLFPEQVKNPRCNNVVCFNNKTVVHQSREFKKAKDDPSVVLVYESFSTPDYVNKLKSEGNEAFKLGYNDDCREIKEPQKPVKKEYERWAKKQNKSEKEIREGFKEAEKTYDFNKEVYEKKLAAGKYKKAFVIYDEHGKQTGRYVTVEINAKKPTAKDAKKAITQGDATVQDIDNEISRLQEREKRNKELDAEKIHTSLVQVLKDCKQFHELPKASNRTDNTLIRFLLIEQIGFADRSTIQKVIKPAALYNTNDPAQIYKCLESLSNQQIAYLVRHILLEKYGSNLPTSSGGFMVRKMAESLGSLIPIADLEKEQNGKAKARQQRVNERIAGLNEEKKKLKKPSEKIAPAKKDQKKNAIAA